MTVNNIERKPLQMATVVGHMAETEPHLATLPGNGDTLGVTVLAGHGLLQLVQLTRLLQLLYQALHHLLAPLLLLLAVLLPAAARLLPA